MTNTNVSQVDSEGRANMARYDTYDAVRAYTHAHTHT